MEALLVIAIILFVLILYFLWVLDFMASRSGNDPSDPLDWKDSEQQAERPSLSPQQEMVEIKKALSVLELHDVLIQQPQDLQGDENNTWISIKQQYKKLALKYHPDKNKGGEATTKHFKKINNAYSVLQSVHHGEPLKFIQTYDEALRFFNAHMDSYC